MSGIVKIALGVVTGIGGFLDAGTIATSAQAGARFQFRLLWVLAVGTLALVFMNEMLGRLVAVSKHTLAGAIRERFGIRYQAVPLVAELFLDVTVLAAELAASRWPSSCSRRSASSGGRSRAASRSGVCCGAASSKRSKTASRSSVF